MSTPLSDLYALQLCTKYSSCDSGLQHILQMKAQSKEKFGRDRVPSHIHTYHHHEKEPKVGSGDMKTWGNSYIHAEIHIYIEYV